VSIQSRIRRSLRRATPTGTRVAASLAALALVAPMSPAAADTTTTTTATTATTGTAAGLTTTSVATPASPLPFDLPAPAVLRSSPRKAFAHYVPWMPQSVDNKTPDYYDRHFLVPDGEGGKHAAYGGWMRDRPLARPIIADTAWKLRDLETDVRQAVAGGLDGFIVDMVQLGDVGGTQWTAMNQLLQAARNVDPGFKIMLMPDMTGTSMLNKDAPTMAKWLAHLGASPAAYKLADGRLVVSPFTAERKTVDYWTSVISIMKTTHNTPVAFFPLFQDERKWRDAFDPISYGMSNWGNRNPAGNNPTTTHADSPTGRAAAVHALGQKWMQPVSVQDQRPRAGIFDEAQNTQNLRNTWQIARQTGAEIVQVPTWNDYPEGTQIAPSAENGWSYLDMSAYYLTWYKTGTAPKIVRDAVYLTHRTQPAAALPSYPQTLLMKLRGGSSPVRDTVEALTFLTAPATVRIKVGTASYTCDVTAGEDTCTVPLGPGAVSAVIERNGAPITAVESPATVTRTPYVQDLQYIASSSGRQNHVFPDTTAPSVPAQLTAAAASGSGVQLSWTPSTDDRGTVSYEVHRSTTTDTAATSTTRIATTTTPSFVHEAVKPGTWHYRVVAVDEAGNRSAASTSAVAVVADTSAPSPVSGVTATAAGGAVTVSWAAATDDVGVTAYEVRRSTTSGTTVSAATVLGTTAGTTLTDSSCPVGTCSYAVVAVDAAGNRGPASVPVSATVQDSTAPSAPSSLRVTLTGEQATLAWTASTDAVGVTGYEVHRSATAGFTPTSSTLVGSATATTWSQTAPAGTWSYRVVARDAASNRSTASAEVRVVVPAPTTVVRVTPSADTYANEGAPSTNFGTSWSLSSRGNLGAVSYLRFAVPAAPTGKTLRSASLQLRIKPETYAGSSLSHSVRVASNTWTESTVTWNSRPAVTTQVLGAVAAGTVPDSTTSTVLSTSAVQSFAGTVRTFAVTGSGEDNLYVWSANHSDASYRPQLVLTYS
jgi:hypothetical protein